MAEREQLLLSNALDALDRLFDGYSSATDVQALLLATGEALRGTAHSPHFERPAAELLADATLELAALTGKETVLELPAGAGLLTAFLAEAAAHVVAIEQNSDAIADLVTNLHDLDNVTLYEGVDKDILPNLSTEPDLVVFHPPSGGVSDSLLETLERLTPSQFIYISTSLATFARDTRRLTRLGYQLAAVQPLDTTPHHFRIDTVALFEWLPDTISPHLS